MKRSGTAFISDLHLSDQRPEITQAFLWFLENIAVNVETLYILGDFFNVWLGDDHITKISQQVATKLKLLTNSGTAVYLMHGNRDFLIGDSYSQHCGATLLKDPTLVELYGTQYLLMHGDSLCTRDTHYMEFRHTVRNPIWQQNFLAKSLAQRQQFAEQARAQSQKMNSNKPQDIMDVTPAEVVNTMLKHQVTHLIHGHTHRQKIHSVKLKQQNQGQRIVLGDWDIQACYLSVTANNLELINFPLPLAPLQQKAP